MSAVACLTVEVACMLAQARAVHAPRTVSTVCVLAHSRVGGVPSGRWGSVSFPTSTAVQIDMVSGSSLGGSVDNVADLRYAQVYALGGDARVNDVPCLGSTSISTDLACLNEVDYVISDTSHSSAVPSLLKFLRAAPFCNFSLTFSPSLLFSYGTIVSVTFTLVYRLALVINEERKAFSPLAPLDSDLRTSALPRVRICSQVDALTGQSDITKTFTVLGQTLTSR